MNKYIITGSIGHISKPIVEGLVQAGKEVSVITSSRDRVPEIESLGAKALVGRVQDAAFLNQAFKGAEVAYTMIPPIYQTNNLRASQQEVGRNYADAIKASAIKHVVNLSSIGAHLEHGTGPILGVHDFEQLLNRIEGLHVKHLRPAYFYYNFLAQIGLIKQAGITGGNFGGKEKVLLTHTRDIAAVALEELLNVKFTGSSVRYIYSDECSGQEIADALGKAIGRDLRWVVFTDEEQRQGLLQAGLPETHASAYTEMGKALREGSMQEDARRNKPVVNPTKLEDFAKEFAAAFQA